MSDNADAAGEQTHSVRAAGDRTLEQYQAWMQTNAASHMLRAAHQSGITTQLRTGQHTAEQLCEALSLQLDITRSFLDALVAIGLVEQYEDDFALARAGHLLCEYDQDLGDRRWEGLVDRLRDTTPDVDLNGYLDRRAATQWAQTSAAMQAAEILDIGGESLPAGIRILDLGCGSAVWSCAMGHRDPESKVVAIDGHDPIEAAKRMAESIGMADRFQAIEGDPMTATVAEGEFEVALLAGQLSCRPDEQAAELLAKAAAAVKSGGLVAAPDLYRGPAKLGLVEATEALGIQLESQGRVRELRESQAMFAAAGLESIQFTYLTASQQGLGMIVGRKA